MKELLIDGTEYERSDDLVAVQNKIKDTLKELDKICKDNNLKYSISSGTLLGAVRHKGFIPWDDDADVYMLREDYDKLLSLNIDNDSFRIINFNNDHDYPYPFAKIYNKKTRINEVNMKDCNLGVYVDIFPCDYIKDESDINSTINLAKKLCSIWFFGAMKNEYYLQKEHKSIIKYVIKICLSPFQHLLCKLINDKFSSKTEGKYTGMLMTNLYGEREIFDSQLWNDIIEYDFEDIKVCGFKDSNKYLTHLYGDYMKLPSVESRGNRHCMTFETI